MEFWKGNLLSVQRIGLIDLCRGQQNMKSNLLPACKEVLLEHSHTSSFTFLSGCLRAIISRV